MQPKAFSKSKYDDFIRHILTDYPEASRNDAYLYELFLTLYYKIDIHKLSVFELCESVKTGKLKSWDYISRRRRKIMENPDKPPRQYTQKQKSVVQKPVIHQPLQIVQSTPVVKKNKIITPLPSYKPKW